MGNKGKEIKADGSFNRQKKLFSTQFGEESGQLPVVEDRTVSFGLRLVRGRIGR